MSRDPYASLKQGLVGAWIPSISGSGLLLPDLSGRGNNGTLTNMGPEDWVASGSGRALDFDGSDDYVDLSSYATQYASLSTGTISLWFNLRTQTTNDVFGLSESSTTNNRFAIGFGNTTSGFTDESLVVVLVRNSTLTIAGFVRNGESFYYDNTWHSLVYVGSDAGNVLYIDGIRQTLSYTFGSSTTAGFMNVSNANSMFLGRRNLAGFPSLFTNGQLDDIRIYNRPLTESEIRLLASKRGIGLQPSPTRFIAKEKKTGLRRLLLTGQT